MMAEAMREVQKRGIMDEPVVVPTDTKHIWFDADGKYWFQDEAEQLSGNGPYDTKQAAIDALKSYSEWLNTPRAVNKTDNLPQSTVKYYG